MKFVIIYKEHIGPGAVWQQKGVSMVGYILGSYLVETGKITKEQLQEVLDGAGKVRVKLGLIAVAEGYMSAAEAEEVNRLQAVLDKRFGDIAVENGYLTEEQVGMLLKKQGDAYMVFLQTLVDRNLMDMTEAEQILMNYQKAMQLTDAEREDIKSGDADRILPIYLPAEASEYRELIGVAIRTMIRCVDRDIFFKKGFMADSVQGKNGSFQYVEAIDGSRTCLGLVEENGGFLTTASLFAGEELPELDEDALDSCAELLNCMNGIYASAKSKEKIELELMPPAMYREDVELRGDKPACILPIIVRGKEMRLIVFG